MITCATVTGGGQFKLMEKLIEIVGTDRIPANPHDNLQQILRL
jgi:hypothetical protein